MTARSLSRGHRLDRPQIWLSLVNFEDRYARRGDIFESNAEALGLWDAIKNTVRLRPGAI